MVQLLGCLLKGGRRVRPTKTSGAHRPIGLGQVKSRPKMVPEPEPRTLELPCHPRKLA